MEKLDNLLELVSSEYLGASVALSFSAERGERQMQFLSDWLDEYAAEEPANLTRMGCVMAFRTAIERASFIQ